MSEQTSEALRSWFRRIDPIYPELFNMAHVICGNYDLAEYALRSAILEVWSQNADSGMGFREKLRGTLRAEALRIANEEGEEGAEFTWPGFSAGAGDELLRLAGRESPEVQRMLMLRYGIGMSPSQIARLTGTTAAQVRTALDRFESRCRRSLSSQERSRFDALFGRLARQQLASRSGIPHPSAVYRAFEAEASGLQVSEHRVTQVVFRLLMLAMAVVCAVLFWLFAVLVQPPDIRPEAPAESDPPAIIETFQETEAPA